MSKENRNKIENEVARTMRSLDGIDRAETDDRFYERLEAKLQKREGKSTPWLVAAAAVIGFLVVFNVFTVLQYQQNYGETDVVTEQSEEQLQLVWDYEAEPIMAGYDLIEYYELTGRD